MKKSKENADVFFKYALLPSRLHYQKFVNCLNSEDEKQKPNLFKAHC